MFNAALLDFDGTLCDTHPAIFDCLCETLKNEPFFDPATVGPLIRSLISTGTDLRKTLLTLLPERDHPDIDLWMERYRRLYFTEFSLARSRLFEGVESFLRKLHSTGTPIVVCSNKHETAIRLALEHFDVLHLVSTIFADNGHGGPKEAPLESFERLLTSLPSVDPSRMLLIGDTDADIRFARTIGIAVGCVTYGYGDTVLLRAAEPDYLFESLDESLSLFTAA